MKATALACTILLAGCGGAASRFASHMDRGRDYLAKEDFTHASLEFRNAMQIAPKDVPARLLAAHTLEKLQQLREAAGLYQSVVNDAPDNIDALASLGHIYVFAGAYDRALETVAPGLAKHPDDVSLLTVRAAARMHTKDETGAAVDAARALRLQPTNEDAIAISAGLYQRAGNAPQAIALVEEGVRKLPKSTDLRQILVQMYVAADEPVKAEEQLRGLIQLKPAVMAYRQQLAFFLARTNKIDDAQRVLEDAVKALPKNSNAKLSLASFLASRRTRAQGEKILRDFIAQEPDNFDLRFGLADLLQRSDDAKGAVDAYSEVISRDGMGPKGITARDRIAAIDLAQGHDEEARKLVGQVLQKNPRDSDALLVRGQLGLKTRDAASAIADLRAVLREQPKSVPAQRLLARAYQMNGQPALAEQTLRSAMDIAPQDTGLRMEFANLLLGSQRTAEGVSLLEETVKSAPTNVAAREMLVRAYLGKGDFAAARTSAEDLKTLSPQSASGPFLAGLAAQGLHQLDEAQKQLARAFELQPRSFEILTALSHVELARGQGAQAIELAKGATEHDPQNAQTFNLLGELYLAQKNSSQGTEALTRATQLAPTWWLPFRNLALARFAAKDIDGAIATYQAGIKAAPTEPRLVIELGALYETQRRPADAIEAYDAWNRRNPREQLIANNLAMLLVTYNTDRASLDRARDLAASFASSNDGSLLDTYGWVHFKREEYSDALPFLQKAAERVPASKEIRYHLGMAELKAGHSDQARTNLEAALAGAAKFSWSDDARKALASLKS